jgi:hypothetical protein
VFVFPELVVCLVCGVSQFSVPKAQLRVLANAEGAGKLAPD